MRIRVSCSAVLWVALIASPSLGVAVDRVTIGESGDAVDDTG